MVVAPDATKSPSQAGCLRLGGIEVVWDLPGNQRLLGGRTPDRCLRLRLQRE